MQFLEYYSQGEFANQAVELIINGDFLDLLAVPFVPYFDDEFWSEKASLDKLDLILKAHPEVMQALNDFLKAKNKSLTYIIGNHDAELYFQSLKDRFLEEFEPELRSKIKLNNELETYQVSKGLYVQHGHMYEKAHQVTPRDNVIESQKGEKYFIPPWGSYYVSRIINRYKQERRHINEVSPVRSLLIHGLIYDTYFTLRFMMANVYYFFMVRALSFFYQKKNWGEIISDIFRELTLFGDFEALTRTFFERQKEARCLIIGHTHKPSLKYFNDGTVFVNTGTWMRAISLDLKTNLYDRPMTYAYITILEEDYELDKFHDNVKIDLYRWAPKTQLPFEEYT